MSIKQLLDPKLLASIIMFACASCNGVNKLGKIPLTNHMTSTNITIQPKHWAIGLNIPMKDDPDRADRTIFGRVFIVNRGKESIRLGCSRWLDDGTKSSHRTATLHPGSRLQFYEGPLSHAGTSFVEVPERSSPMNLQIEIEPISRLDRDYLLTIYARWGHGIDL